MMIKILDYGMGNCGSVANMLRYLGADSEIVTQPVQLETGDAIILPGVGAFDHGCENLAPFRQILEKRVIEGNTPFLGICLGMQLLFEDSEEGGLPGLGWIPGRVVRFNFSEVVTNERLVIPHMGWNQVHVDTEGAGLITVDTDRYSRFYFVHSYHAAEVQSKHEIARCHYGYDFTCAVQSNNIFGVQFHPEKSHKNGMRLLSSFIELSQC